MKVYCKNCKWLDCINMCEINLKNAIDQLGIKYKTGWIDPYKKNRDYNCPDYKCKWYKFWIKER